MTARPPLLLLSDVDGTLISEDGALPVTPLQLRSALRDVAATWRGALIVGLASSRTLRELSVLQRALGVYGPCIAEDGALRVVDVAQASTATHPASNIEQHGRRLLAVYEHATPSAQLRAHMMTLKAFRDADTDRRSRRDLQRLGFASPGAQRRALEARTHSVLLDPSVWTSKALADLRSVSAANGWHLRRGGRWFTLTSSGGKGPALRALRHQFTDLGVAPIVAAIGNEENDQSLLAEADLRFVIRNPHRGPHPALSALPGAMRLHAEGTGGWMEMLDHLVPRAAALLETHA